MLATIQDDTWNVSNMQHITTNSEEVVFFRHPRWWQNTLKMLLHYRFKHQLITHLYLREFSRPTWSSGLEFNDFQVGYNNLFVLF